MTWVHQKCSSRTRGSPSRAFGSRVQWPPCVICQRDVRKACVRHGCPSRRRITMTKRLIIILLKPPSHTTTPPSNPKSFYLTGEPAHPMPKYRPWHPRHTAIETHEWPFPFQSDLYRCKQFRTHGTCNTAPVNSQTLVKAVGLLLNPEPPQQANAHTWQDQTSVHSPQTHLQSILSANTTQQSQLQCTHTHTHTQGVRVQLHSKEQKAVYWPFCLSFLPPSFLSCPPWRPIHTCLLATGAGATVVEER